MSISPTEDEIKNPQIAKIVQGMQQMSQDYANSSETMIELVELVKFITEEIKENNPALAGRIYNKMMDIMGRYQNGMSVVKT